MIRPHPAEWFEIVVARDDTVMLLDALARDRCVELEAESGERQDASAELQRLLRRFDELAERFAAYWPPPETLARPLELRHMAQEALSALEAWAAVAAPSIETLRSLEAERAQLALWRQVLAQIGNGALDLAAIAAPRDGLQAALFVFAPEFTAALPTAVLVLPVKLGGESGVLALGPREALAALAQQVTGAQGRKHKPPTWLRSDARESVAFATRRLETVEESLADARARLGELSAAHRLGEMLGRLRHAQWMLRSIGIIACGENFCRVTGWTDDPARLNAALAASGARALAHFPSPPAGIHAPLLLQNPWWARPFEVFARAFGMPAPYAADPSAVLAFVAPLLFGYMFGDIGQGAVLVAAGLAMRKRAPILRLLVGGGISAMLFGWLFGSVFGAHGVVPALWLSPLEEPLPVLVVPLFGGALLLLAGLAINALESYWRGKLRHWLAGDAGLIAVYAGILLGLFDRTGYVVAALGAIANVVGHLVVTRRWRSVLGALGALVERTLQLLINTLSFVRVGAFALAHAGLSAAIFALADAASGALGYGAIVAAGNVVVIVVEATVVSVQTTRLVLFEFFTRFFVSKGREFRPLPPPAIVRGELREATH